MRIRFHAILLLALLGPSAHAALPKPSPPAALRPFDELFKRRADADAAEKALAGYRSAFHGEPTAESGWRLAMADYFVGLRLRSDEDRRRELYSEGIAAGRAALSRDESCAECHFWTAINMALYGQSIGAFKMLFSLAEIREHLEKSLALDPAYAFGGAYRLLGLIEQKLPGILGGDDERAEADFKRAIEIAPDEPLNYLFLAKLLRETKSRRAEALAWLAKAMGQATPGSDRLESIEARRDIQKLREELLRPD